MGEGGWQKRGGRGGLNDGSFRFNMTISMCLMKLLYIHVTGCLGEGGFFRGSMF